MHALLLAVCLAGQPDPTTPPAADLPEVLIDRDNVRIDRSCRVVIPEGTYLPDADNNGVIHVAASGITIDFGDRPRPMLRSADFGRDYETITGIGIRIDRHADVTIRGASVHRYKQGIWATRADNLVLDDCDVSEGYAMRLGSTPHAEDSADWLWPHDNDQNQWATNYGAGIWIEDSRNVTVSRCIARSRQNGLILENVTDSRIYDNDFSFLSGWGIAMWRSSRNTISRNALDFCIRGYSHGIYNRGQDSAGILLFEQCNNNLFIANSATHGGDGVFGFGGKEALGQTPAPTHDADGNPWTYERKGCNDNVFIDNDFSFAAAHGLELTFSFGNIIVGNTFAGNAICGIWGGYSQDTLIDANQFMSNGDAGYGLERGAINIEHSQRNTITNNSFLFNTAGVHLWHDADPGLMQSPWALANHDLTRDNAIVANEFMGEGVDIHLRDVRRTTIGHNSLGDAESPIVNQTGGDGEAADTEIIEFEGEPPANYLYANEGSLPQAIGSAYPKGAQSRLAGRQYIVMNDYFPWDPIVSMVRRGPDFGGAHTYEVYGVPGSDRVQASLDRGSLRIAMVDNPDSPSGESSNTWSAPPSLDFVRVQVVPEPQSDVTPYTLRLGGALDQVFQDVILHATWDVVVFDSPCDPREDLQRWRIAAVESPNQVRGQTDSLSLRYAHGGIEAIAHQLTPPRPADSPFAAPGPNNFGTIATTTLRLPPGRWRITTLSDDGLRVIVNDQTIIENWTHHGPTHDSAEFEVVGDPAAQPVETHITVEHFELDGYAILELKIEPVTP